MSSPGILCGFVAILHSRRRSSSSGGPRKWACPDTREVGYPGITGSVDLCEAGPIALAESVDQPDRDGAARLPGFGNRNGHAGGKGDGSAN